MSKLAYRLTQARVVPTTSLYPFRYEPKYRGINAEEIFIVMPFDDKYRPVLTDLITPATEKVATQPKITLSPYCSNMKPTTKEWWKDVLDHLSTAQIVLGVLTKDINANVHYYMTYGHFTVN